MIYNESFSLSYFEFIKSINICGGSLDADNLLS